MTVMIDSVYWLGETRIKHINDSVNRILAHHAEDSEQRVYTYKFAVALREEGDGNVVGGVIGEKMCGWLYISKLAVEKAYRGQGWGRKLLERAEKTGDGNCEGVWLTTYGFQAVDFYIKCGYEVFATLLGPSDELNRYFMRKKLK